MRVRDACAGCARRQTFERSCGQQDNRQPLIRSYAMRTRLLLSLLAALALVGACRNADPVVSNGGQNTGTDKVPASQTALVEFDYVNFAWGHQHYGVVVYADGSVYKYAWQRNEAPWNAPEGSSLTVAQLSEKHTHGRQLVGTVSVDTLALIRALIPAAARGTQTERTATAADMGSYQRSAYVIDQATERYTVVPLRVVGDWSWHNTAPEAAQLADVVDAIAARHQ
jgi:hypothetical protein